MEYTFRRRPLHRAVLLLAQGCFCLAAAQAAFACPKNIVLVIGDGMGPEQVKSGGMYLHGSAGTLSFEAFPHRGLVTTRSADSDVTDSAASATAIATGHKVNNKVVSAALPGDGGEYTTLLEYFSARGKRTGLVTTDFITGATPACFGAHAPARGDTAKIAADYLRRTRPNILFGGGGNGLTAAGAERAGYAVVTNKISMQALNTAAATHVSGQFGKAPLPYEYDGTGALPSLSEMTRTALRILDDDPDGFFLVVENALIDHAGHANDIVRLAREVAELDAAVREVLTWNAGRNDTLLLVTADHETGGLTVTANNGPGKAPSASWKGPGHTGTKVPAYASGPNSSFYSGTFDNTGFFGRITTCP